MYHIGGIESQCKSTPIITKKKLYSFRPSVENECMSLGLLQMTSSVVLKSLSLSILVLFNKITKYWPLRTKIHAFYFTGRFNSSCHLKKVLSHPF